MEIVEFLKVLFGSIDIVSIIVVFVLVWLWGQLGATGKIQLASSFVTGLVVGIIQQFGAGALVDFSSWLNAIFYGIILGGLASGAYEAIKHLVAKATGDALGLDEE
jgi:hypothetical protein